MKKIIITMSIFLVAALSACDDNASEPQENSAACSSNGECEGGVCLKELGTGLSDDPITFKGGYCTNECSWDEEAAATVGCAENELCLFYDANIYDDIPSENYCYVMGCETDWDCRDTSYTCVEFGFFFSEKACVPYDANDPKTKEYQEKTQLMSLPLSETIKY